MRFIHVAILALVGCSPAVAPKSPTTARGIISVVQAHVPLDWNAATVDTFKAGDPDTPVTGIAVTMMATLDVLERAAAHGQNLIITHEPTFFDHLDKPAALEDADPIWRAKRDFINQHHLVVWRFHDHWHEMTPDGIEAGMVQTLGWSQYQDRENQYRFTLPRTTLRKLADDIANQLDRPLLRIVGDPDLSVSRIALEPGSPGFKIQAQAIAEEGVDVLVSGEGHEWEIVEYAADTITAGKKKALILLGHIPSEQAGMLECARWLKTFITVVPVEFVAAEQPFWTLPNSGRRP